MADPPAVSVLIPTRDRREPLRRALEALAHQTLAAARYEVVVAVDGSRDGTRELLATMDTPFALQVAEVGGRGRAAGCNAALALARGAVLVILDDDMEVVPEFIERHLRHHPPGSRVCVMGAAPIRLDARSPLAARHVQTKFAEHLARLAEPGHVYSPRDFYSGNASLRAEVLREVGGFDERFTAYGNEDVELWVRLRAAGVDFGFDRSATAFQEYGKDMHGLAGDTYAKGGTAVLLARAHPEVFHALRLATPDDSSRPWLRARSLLLALTRRRPATARALFAAAAALERAGLWRSRLFYRAVLDYAFWAGVDAALGDDEGDAALAPLAQRLRT
jgi:GT2 family glycosyltransferase